MTESDPVMVPVDEAICPRTGLNCEIANTNMTNIDSLAINLRKIEDVYDIVGTNKSEEKAVAKTRAMISETLTHICPDIINGTCAYLIKDGEISG